MEKRPDKKRARPTKEKKQKKDNRFPHYNLEQVELWIYASEHKNSEKERKKVYHALVNMTNHLLNIMKDKPNCYCKCPFCIAHSEHLKSQALNMGFSVVSRPLENDKGQLIYRTHLCDEHTDHVE
jgi:hypothetical protein